MKRFLAPILVGSLYAVLAFFTDNHWVLLVAVIASFVIGYADRDLEADAR